MSIRDKIRDELYGSDDDDRAIQESIEEYEKLSKSLSPPFAAFFTLAVCLLIEGTWIGLQFFARSWVRHFSEDEDVILLGILGPFVLGFFLVFSACKLWRSSWTVEPPTTRDDMPTFTDYNRGEPKMAIFFVSVGGGILNTLVLWGLHSIWY